APHLEHRARDVGFIHERDRPVHELERGFHLELRVHVAQQVAQAAEGLLTKGVREGAEAALDHDASRHDVPGAVAAYAPDRRVALHAFVLKTFDHGVKSLDQEGLRREHVAATAHHAAVTAGTRKCDLVRVRPGPHEPRPGDHGARLGEARDVEPDDRVGTVVVEQSARDHGLGAAHDLLGRLEHEQEAAAYVRDAVNKCPRNADHDPHVGIVTACVHATVRRRLELDPGLLVNRQGVDVGAEHYGLARPTG